MSVKYFKCIEDTEKVYEYTITQILDWVRSNELRDIVYAFGGEIPQSNDVEILIEWLLDFSDIWDYRKQQQTAFDEKTKEAARWLVSSDSITKTVAEKVFSATDVLGLTGVEEPMLREYDYVIALGGARLSCALRPKYAKYIISKKELKPKAVIMLSGIRPVSDSERGATDTYAPNANTEFDLINEGAKLAFGIKDRFHENRYFDQQNMNTSWAIRTYKADNLSYPLISIAGPSTEPDLRRANSADTYKFFFEKYNIQPNEKILLITSQIYVPYQQLEAIRTLAIPYNIVVETIGLPNEWAGQMQGMREPGNYLQEIRSTIQAISRFVKGNKLR